MRAVTYARVSTQEQARPDATSVSSQLERAASYAAAQGWEVVAELADEGVSGALSLAERPQGRRLLASDADVLIFWSMDRFTRSAVRGLGDLEALEASGKTIVFVKEAIDTSTAAGRMFRSMLAVFSQFERETIRERMGQGRLGALRQGRWPGGPKPFGYETDDSGRLIIGANAEVVRDIFKMAAAGESTVEIADILKARGHTGPWKDPWHNRTVSRIVRRLGYTGSGHPRSELGETHLVPSPAIVDPDLWAIANAAVEATTKRQRDLGNGRKRTYALSGRIFHLHGEERVPMHSRAHRGKRRYRCNVWKTCPGLGDRRRETSVWADEVEAALILFALDMLEDPETLQDLAESAQSVVATEADEDRRIDRLDELDARTKALVSLIAGGKLSEEEAEGGLADIAAERDAILNAAEQAAEDRSWEAALLATLRSLEDFTPRLLRPDELNPSEPEWEEQAAGLRSAALKTLEESRPLDPESILWADELAKRLGLIVLIEAGAWLLEGRSGTRPLRLATAARCGRSLRRPLHMPALVMAGLVRAVDSAAPVVRVRVPVVPPGLRRRLTPALTREHASYGM